jgi:aerobic-type carbon monoxide dehydrogenase small subunit (CoxS/CutS family)
MTQRRDGERAPTSRRKVHLELHVNGEAHEVAFLPHKTLLEVLREDLGLTGTKHGCELGECGTCTVLVDGKPVLSCLALGLESDGREITTVEGLAGPSGPHPLQTAFADLNAAQCGYCTPGFLCTAKALLDGNPSPSRAEIAERLSGNLCRCTGYLKIFEAVERAAAEMRGEPVPPVEDAIRG